jgi:HK97 gp10 family phage protein
MITARLTKNRLPNLPREVRQNAITVINRHARNVAAIARQLVHVKSGETRDSIAVSESSLGTVRVVVGGAGLYLELGTVHMGPFPFLRPAVESDRPGLMSDLAKAIK